MEKVALIIGHNARSKGAFSMIVGSEFSYWKNIAEKVKGEIPELVDIYERKPSTNYVIEMKEVLKELNKFCLELHFNSSLSPSAKGCECLVYYKNDEAKKLAIDLMARLQSKFKSTVRGNRGLIEVQDSNVRGGYGICNSKDTYILIEPFFGSNIDESLRFSIVKDVVSLLVEFIKDNL